MLSLEGEQRNKPRLSVDSTAEPGSEAVDILVDIIIGFLEKSTAYLRAVGKQAFTLLSGSVRSTTIDLILAVRPFFFWVWNSL
jgi:DNA polymerase phi